MLDTKTRISEDEILLFTDGKCNAKDVVKIQKPTWSYDGIKELRDILLSANNEVCITSLYVTDDLTFPFVNSRL